MSSVYFPWGKDGVSTEGIQGLRRKCFSHEHTERGGGKGTAIAQAGQSTWSSTELSGRRSEMVCTDIRREIIDVHNFALLLGIVKCVLSYANGCLWRATQCSCVSYPLVQASESW